MEEASLSDFVGDDGSTEDDESGDDAVPDERDGAVEGSGGADEPAKTTYAFSPDGRACAACDADARRLWLDGDRLVCPACKEW